MKRTKLSPKELAKKESSKKKPFIIETAPAKLWQWTLGILAVAFVVFSPALSNELLSWDDYNYIRDNLIIRDLSFQNILHIFNFKTFVVGNYHPLTVLSYAFEYKMAGVNPLLYHLDNILLHLLNIYLIGQIVWLLTKEFYTSIICVALFAIHPMRVESVVWAAERKDVLYTLFFLLSWLFYIRYILNQSTSKKLLLISLVLFLCSILSKGQAVILPLVFILTNYWYDGKFDLKKITPIIPFFVLSLIFGMLAVNAQSSSLTEERLGYFTFGLRVLTANFNILAYIYKFLMPWNLSGFYGYFPKAEMWKLYIAPVGVIVLFSVLYYKFRTNKIAVFGFLFYLFTISIVTQILPVGNAIIADRYTYIPYIGLFFIVAKLLNDYLAKNNDKRKMVLTVLSILLVAFGVKSFLQSRTWHSSFTFWEEVLNYNDKEPTAYMNLAVSYQDKKDYNKAVDLYSKCLANRETFMEPYKAYTNLGVLYTDQLKYDSALYYYNQAVLTEPKYLDGVFYRGLAYTKVKDYQKSIDDFTYILTTLNPKYEKAYFSRGIAYRGLNQFDKAIADYKSCLAINPQYGEAYVNMGNIYFSTGNYDLALSNYNENLKLSPQDGNTLLNISKTYFQKGDYQNAYSFANKAAQNGMPVDPPYIEILKQKLQ